MLTRCQGLQELDRQNLGSEISGSTSINERETLVECLAVFEYIAKTYALKESTGAKLLTTIAKLKEFLK